MRHLAQAIEKEGLRVVAGVSYADAQRLVEVLTVNRAGSCQSTCRAGSSQWQILEEVLAKKRRRNDRLPIFLFGEQRTAEMVPTGVLKHANAFMHLFEDSPEFLAASSPARQIFISSACLRRCSKRSWITHCMLATRGTPPPRRWCCISKKPCGNLFYEFFGENTLRSDVSVSVACLARYSIIQALLPQGTQRRAHLWRRRNALCRWRHIYSQQDRLARMVGKGDLVLCDRNCHKSILHSL